MTELTPSQRKSIETRLKLAEEIQRIAMSKNAWKDVWDMQGAIAALCALLDREPWVNTP